MDVGEAIIRIEADGKQVLATMEQLKSTVETNMLGLGKHFNDAQGGLDGIGKYARMAAGAFLGFTGAQQAVAALKSVLIESVGVANQFDDEMDQVQQRLSADGLGAMKAYEAAVLSMSVKFGEGTASIAAGLGDIVDRGYAPADALSILNDAATLAKGGLSSTAVEAKNLTQILAAYNLDATESARVTDLIANVSERGAGLISAISGAMAGNAKMAADNGVAIDEYAAALATMTRNGMTAEQASTALRMIIMELTKEDEKAAAAGDRLGVSIAQGKLEAGEFTKVIEAAAAGSEKDQNAIVSNAKARTGWNALLKDSKGYVQDLTVEMQASGTAHERAARILTEEATKFEQLKQASHLALVGIGEGVRSLLMSTGAFDVMINGLAGLGKELRLLAAGDIASIALEVEDTIDSFRSQETALQGLVGSYDALVKRMENIPEGSPEFIAAQKELQSITDQIAKIVPEAVTAWGEYGKALGINRERVSEYAREQRELLKIEMESKKYKLDTAISEGEGDYKALQEKRAALLGYVEAYKKGIEEVKASGDLSAETTAGMQDGALSLWAMASTTGERVEYLTDCMGRARTAIADVNEDMREHEKNLIQAGIIQKQLGEFTTFWGQATGLIPGIMDKAADAIKKTDKAATELLTTEQKHAQIIGSIKWADYYSDQERLSGRTTAEIIADIERQMAKYEEEKETGSESYRELCDLRTEYIEKSVEDSIKAEEDARQKIADIWNGVGEDVKNSMSTALGDMFAGDSNFKDALKGLGDQIKTSFTQGFASALVEKSGFDLKFKNNMLDLGGFASNIFGGKGGGGLLGGLSGMFSGVTDWLGITGGAVEGLGAGLGEVTVAAGETGAALDFAGAQNIIETTEAAKAATPALEATGEAATTAGQGIAGMNLALPAVGVYLAAISGQFGETAQKISFVGTEAAALTALLGPMGALLGGVGGTLVHFGQDISKALGIGGKHVTFEEEFGKYLEDFAEGTKTQGELFNQVFLRMTNYATDFWGTQENMLEADYQTRLDYYNKYAELKDKEGNLLFSEEQLSKLRDALQISTDETERAAMAARTSFEVAGKVINDKFFNQFKDSAWMMDSIAGWETSWNAAVSEAQASGGDVWAIFEQKMAAIPGMTEDVMSRVRESIAEAKGEVDLSIETQGMDESFQKLADTLGAALGKAGTDIDKFSAQVKSVAEKYLGGMDIDLGASLKSIPGMTGDYVGKLKDQLSKLKDKGITEFTLDPEFEKRLRAVTKDPSLAGGGKGDVKYGGLLIPNEQTQKAVEGLTRFTEGLISSGQALSGLNDQQAGSLLNLIGVQDTASNRQMLVGQSAEGTAAALGELLKAAYGASDGQGILAQGFGDLQSRFGQFDWSIYMNPLEWQTYIKAVNLGNYVEGVDIAEILGAKTGRLAAGGESVTVNFASGSIQIGRVGNSGDLDGFEEAVFERIVAANRRAMRERK